MLLHEKKKIWTLYEILPNPVNSRFSGYLLYGTVLDIKGAFDKVWHTGLCSKLMANGVYGKLLTWIRSYLSDCSFRVVLSGQSFSTHSINASVPQGSIFGSFLLSVLMTWLRVRKWSLLNVDDSTLFCEVTSNGDLVAGHTASFASIRIWRGWRTGQTVGTWPSSHQSAMP